MLSTLTIKNYALIENLQVDFNSGFTIITGETGAGKSILLGGLSLILGKRADISMVKDSSKKCIVEAIFNIAKYNLKPFFKEYDLDYESLTIIRREILPSGKSRAFINDSPVTLVVLQSLSNHLIDIHSQHETLALIDSEFQLQLIDALADNANLLQNYKENYRSYYETYKQLEKLKGFQAEAIKEKDYNAFLLEELGKAQLVEGELEQLEEEHNTLNNVEFIKENLAKSIQLLKEENIGSLTTLRSACSSLLDVSKVSSNYEVIYQRVNSILIELDDIIIDIEQKQENIEANPFRFEEVNEKLQFLNSLFKKHNSSSIEELLFIQSVLSKKMLDSESVDSEIEIKIKMLLKQENVLKQLSKAIHESRKEAVPRLLDQLTNYLSLLGMPNAQFSISVEMQDKLLKNGSDQLQFLFSANKGSNFSSLKKAASGGELSRIMLAIKAILSKYQQLPIMMFDEIDSGVSGEVSNKMANIMKSMSVNIQVFAITHLPQVAAKGDYHFKVYKEDIEGHTLTQLKHLSNDERIVEIAQMLGGTKVSDSAIIHAKELLN